MASQGRHGAKTRTACLTCKARKVKCSEERPACRRCIKTGRTCEGYQLVLVDGTSTIINRTANLPTINGSDSLLSAFSATEDEWQAYRLYTQSIACRLGGAFDTDLWQKLVIQISQGNATVRNGVFAIGNLFRHRSDETNRHISTCSCSHCLHALRSYNKSITSFSKNVARLDDPASVNAALASCAVFICIEYYRMNDRNAIALIDKGCGMLFESRHATPDVQKRGIHPAFINLFGRLRVLSATFGYTVARPLLGQASTGGDMLQNLSDRLERARSSLYDIMAATQALRLQSFQVLVPLWPLGSPSASIQALHNDREAIMSRLQIWEQEFAELRKLLWPKPLESSLPALILHAHFLKTKIYTETSMDLSQARYDKYLPEFQGIAEAVEHGLPQLLPADETANFSFETCFLPTLYLSALKCRQPALRRRMLVLMRLSREKEGLWHRDESIRVATRVIELEEGRSDFVPDINDHIDRIPNVPIRFHDVLCGVNYVKDGKTMVDVTYVLYDDHSEHQWQSMKETLLVDE